MAAPSGISWGSVAGSNGEARLGIYYTTSSTDTQTTISVQVWFWSKWAIYDVVNTFCADWDTTAASTSVGSASINVTSNTDWSGSNQVLIGSYSKTYTRGSSAATKYFATSLTIIEAIGTSTVLSHYISFSVPAAPVTKYTMTIQYDDGIQSVTGAGSYAAGSAVNIGATPKTGYVVYSAEDLDNGKIYYDTSTMLIGWNMNANRHIYIHSGASLDVNGTLNGASKSNVRGFGTFDLYVNGVLTNSAVTEFSDNIQYGSTYKIVPKANTGYSYGGIASGSSPLEGTINKSLTVNLVFNGIYTLTFNPNGGTIASPGGNLYNSINPANSVSVIYNGVEYRYMDSDIPTRVGYKFAGWYTSASGGTQIFGSDGNFINDGTYWKNNVWVYAGNVTVYAHWDPLPVYVRVNGVYKPGIVYIRRNGVYELGTMSIRTGGTYKR